MSDNEEKLREYLKRTTADLRQARRRLRDAEERHLEPIAIIGVSCRFPGGVRSPEDFWELLETGTDAIGPGPTDRGWDLRELYHPDPDHSSTTYATEGGFLHDAGDFDPEFFGMSPREALATDPQQRILLELAWEAFEHAGIVPSSVRGSRTGVFTGVMSQHYAQAVKDFEGYIMTGTLSAVASGRISYTFGLEGPAVTVDTACSSSLVTLHQACQSLRTGECDLALSGGATVMATPNAFLEFSRQRGLAPDGRCKAFAAAADGTGWGEGAGLLLLERLSDAQRNGHTILAVVRGSAVNQDGASNGLTAPNGPSQQRVIQAALANARLNADQVDAVEAHGTGTTLGDPMEAEALLATYGQDRPADQPLYLGSVKSNIGHTQAAAGAAGIIKMIYALRHATLPASLHIDEPTPHVDWSTGTIRLLTHTTTWPQHQRPRRAGISAFGVSGTNAHVILEQAPDTTNTIGDTTGDDTAGGGDASVPWPTTWLLSARDTPGLHRQATTLHHWATTTGHHEHPDTIATTLAHHRTHHPYRAAILTTDEHPHPTATLHTLTTTTDHPALITTPPTGPTTGKTVFVFPGQGSQWDRMATTLLPTSPTFRQHLHDCADALAPHTGWNLIDVLTQHPDAPPLDGPDIIQPALWAVMISLAKLWQHHGIHPDAVIGHSQGEIAAAHIAGALTLDDAATLITRRSQTLTHLPPGAMAAINLPADTITNHLTTYNNPTTTLTIAAHNSPTHTVIAGNPEQIHHYINHCHTHNINAKLIPVTYASHSHHIETLKNHLLTTLNTITPHPPTIPFHTTTNPHPTGEPTDTTTLTAQYWYDNLRNPVHLHPTITTLLTTGHTTYIETSPHPVLTPAITTTTEHHPHHPKTTITGTLRKNHHDPTQFLTNLATIHTHTTHTPTWPTNTTHTTTTPTYTFVAERHWLTANATVKPGQLGLDDPRHPILRGSISPARSQTTVLSGQLSLDTHPWLADHAVLGTVILPGAALVDMALTAGAHAGVPHLQELTLASPLLVPETGELRIQVQVGKPDADGHRAVTVDSTPAGLRDTDSAAADWTTHATGVLAETPERLPPDEPAPVTWPAAGWMPFDVEDGYTELAERGYEYGPAFRGLEAAWRAGDHVYAEVRLPDAAGSGFALHPALLDATLHAAGLGRPDDGTVRLPFVWTDVHLHAAPVTAALRVRVSPTGPDAMSVRLWNTEGEPVATIGTLALRPLPAGGLTALTSDAARPYRIDWTVVATAGATPRHYALIGAAGDEPADALRAEGHQVHSYPAIAALRETGHSPDVTLLFRTTDGDDPIGDAHDVARRTLADVQEWLRGPDGRLIVVTAGVLAVSVSDHVDGLPGSVVHGLVRSANSEHPGRFGLIDLQRPADDAALLSAAVEALTDEETEIAVRDGELYAPRLSDSAGRTLPVPETTEWSLTATEKGTLDALALVPDLSARRPLGPNEIRLAVRASGLNFRDVLIALDMYGGDVPLGSEGAGVVTEIGAEVTGIAPGDRVTGLIPGGIGPVVITDHRLVVPIPDDWSFAQAATVPVAFLTAWYGLVEVGQLKAGETVLVHAAAGGVGMAAVQVAHAVGARVLGTANPTKWGVLAAMGLDSADIASSRDATFEAAFRAATDDNGVDVVLNSLTGDLLDASLRLLAPGGRLVEMGITDRRGDQVQAAYPNVSYLPFELFTAEPEWIRAALGELVARFRDGVLTPLPLTATDVRFAPDVLRRFAQGRHTGKLVLTMPPRPDPDGTVLITGGTGTLGALLARHLVETGVTRRLVLTSRQGGDAPGADGLRRELTDLGAQVEVASCDIAVRADVARVLAGIDPAHPLTAVVHAAGRLEDHLVTDLSAQDVEDVLRAKVDGAWHLHELTAGADLGAFVLFSSVAGILGAPGQANYAAANTFLDALAQHRAAAGLPSTSMAWGYWEQATGLTEHLGETGARRISGSGLIPLTVARGLALFDAALAGEFPLSVPAGLDLAALRARAARTAVPAVLRDLVRSGARRAGAGSPSPVRRLARMDEAERRAALLELVLASAGAVLGHAEGQTIDPGRAFKELGFDSLTAVELRNRLGAATGLRLPATMIFDYPTPAELAAFLDTEFAGSTSATVAPTAPVAGWVNDDPIAIVGMSCRYPGNVANPEDLWRLVEAGRDVMSDFPDDRGWDVDALYDPEPDQRGRSYVRRGGFLDGAGDFDAEFFGMSPREAVATDPQQRLLLETAWEVVEASGIDPTSLRGSRTGVFAGVVAQEYAPRRDEIPEDLEGYIMTGNTTSTASGRVSYVLGLEGPAVTVDTACSSSLVALHQACQSLRGGECDLALAGGVTVMATPGLFVEFSRQRGLAADGRCKPFAAAADGTAFAEGAGLLLLERLSDAQRNGHQVLAVVQGSAINQDGASNGLTAPNGPSQQRVIRAALTSAGLSAADVDVVEAHGTGTALGDPIEAQALLATYGRERPADRPLLLGSVKSNLGHTQAAAGVAGIIKMVQAMRYGVVPASLHIDAPTPHVDWAVGAVRLLTEPTSWPEAGRPRRAAVSSFGISGTNAHVIIEQSPVAAAEPLTGEHPPVLAWSLTAKSTDALREQARRLGDLLAEHPEAAADEVAVALATTRARFDHRAVAVGEAAELVVSLDDLAAGRPTPAIVTGAVSGGRTAFLFTGQGSQRAGMGQSLYATYPAFATALDAVAAGLDEHLDQPIRRLLFAPRESADARMLDQTQYGQPALFALEVALFRLLESWRVHPDVLIGHSIGELAAAHVAGVLNLPDACALITARGRLMQQAPDRGTMIAVAAAEDEVLATLTGWEEQVAIAAINGPASVVLSGDEAAVTQLAAHWQQAGRRTKRLRVSHAFHSPHMDRVLAEFEAVAGRLTFRPPTIPIVSNLTGLLATDEELCSPAYWSAQIRRPVRFLDGMRTLAGMDVRRFLEVGPDAVLSAAGPDCLLDRERGTATFASTLRSERPEERTLLSAVAAVNVRGTDADWATIAGSRGARPIPLPTYPFQRRRYWLQPAGRPGDATGWGLDATAHCLLAGAVGLADGAGTIFTGRLSRATQPWLVDHAVGGVVLIPGTALLEIALEAGAALGVGHVAELALEAPLVLPDGGAVQLQVSVGADTGSGDRPISVHARPEGGTGAERPWTRHAAGVLTEVPDRAYASAPAAWPPPGAESLPVGSLYPVLADAGLDYGPAFRGVEAAWRSGDDILAEVRLPESARAGGGFLAHPALLDAALHPLALTAGPDEDEGSSGPRLPFVWQGVTSWQPSGDLIRVRLTPDGSQSVAITVADTSGRPVLSAESLALRRITADQLAAAGATGTDGLYVVDWIESRVSQTVVAPVRYAVLADCDPEVRAALAAEQHLDVPALAAAVDAGTPVPDVVIAGLPARSNDPAADVHVASQAALCLVQAWLAAGSLAGARLVLVTRGAVAPSPGLATDPVATAAWGLVRSAQSEHAGRFTLVDLDGHADPGTSLAQAIATGEPQVAMRDGVALTARLTPFDATHDTDRPQVHPNPDGTVLVVGATGGLGRRLSLHLARRHGSVRLLLVSRSGRTADTADFEAQLTALGARFRIAACDASDRQALADLIASLPADEPLTGIVNAAGVVEDGVVATMTAEQLDAVLTAKADIAWNLHDLTRESDVAHFVMFSSFAGVVGSPGQANYAAANAALDGLVAHRRAVGLPGVSIAWGAWDQTGLTAVLDQGDQARMRRTGIVPLTEQQGLALFDVATEAGPAELVAARLDRSVLRRQAAALPPLLRALVPAVRTAAPSGPVLAERLAGLDDEQADAVALEFVRSSAAAVLGHADAAGVEPDKPFTALGMDSLAAVEMRNLLTEGTGLRLTATMVFDFPTPAALARHLRTQVTPAANDAAGSILAELDRIEAALADTSGWDDSTRGGITGRLESLLARCRPSADLTVDEVVDRIQTASHDEIFEFIDRDLGRSTK
ncbi:SDR family NAD(P)-dependent oxidoreductase [Micromonospora lupini]|uniref:SDR family NAD(P)-dependent oxidoreductase n=1 Tax=Micromonospora lupini TaxID=285679 RepID=UPI0033F9D2C0